MTISAERKAYAEKRIERLTRKVEALEEQRRRYRAHFLTTRLIAKSIYSCDTAIKRWRKVLAGELP